ncbi:hypothetical protein RBG61_06640 [Paludicola sp. MB14-C6]|uniref:hypothetical protein n=1 Tax=Paludihabitans sp. MB14-C6 TaxID=3070656 RepID=UPI0027DB6B62|nr:hypothetical protein [Paludicola sp. MB14-C6]WMJ24339.1 hypothetical protein RBG61_06640 [Paludicola sp. MB14-C6]
MQTLTSLYTELSSDKNRWSYYPNPNFDIKGTWNNNDSAFAFITSYFEYAGKSQCLKDQRLEDNCRYIKSRATHIISTFLLGVKLFESFGIKLEPSDERNMNLKYYWFLTCLYHDIGYAFEKSSTCEQLRMLQSDGLDAIQEVADIKYLHEREFKTFSRKEIDLYLRGRAQCYQGRVGCIDHGIIGGLLLYDKLRRQFEISWKRRTWTTDCRESFLIKDECSDRTLHLSNKHYDAYAKAADAIMVHNVWNTSFNEYVDRYDTQNQIKKHTCEGRISKENILCFILAIADTLEPLKRQISLNDICFESITNGFRIELEVDDTDHYDLTDLETWVAVKVNTSHQKNKKVFAISL